ncbi:MAG TPA: Crp/Fnr family transcriptional regulator [Thermoanaerobaculia bacterium]|nr:Crp/Fnr family transcriptional regulator [Thermoanaerobaculia bacterium]
MADTLTLVQASPLFRDLPEPERQQLARRTVRRRLERREILFHQGDDANAAYLLASGQLRLSKLNPDGEQVIVSFIVPGQVFAVVAGMQTTRYPVTAEAVEQSDVLVWSREVLREVMQRYPAVAFEAMRTVSARMQDLQERYRELASLPVPQRLARALLRLTRQAGRESDEGLVLEMRLGRQDLAELTGTTLYTASRTLAGWEKQGILASSRERVVIRDRGALEALASEELPAR